MDRIYVGSVEEPEFYFDDDSIEAVPTAQAVSLLQQELSIDTFTPIVRDKAENAMDVTLIRSSNGKVIELANGQIYAAEATESPTPSPIIDIPDGTPVWYYCDGELVGKFYLQGVNRVGQNKYRLNCVSAIGLLDKMDHGGGLFLQSTVGNVLAHILAAGLHGDGEPVISYSIDDDVAELLVSGWLPKATKRMNLYRLMLGYGISIIKGADGNPHFTFFYPAEAPEDIDSDDLFLGGNVKYTKPYSAVAVLEHTYTALQDADSVTLYDNTNDREPIVNKEVWFSQAPVIVETISATTGLTVISATENSAILTGQGVLTGVPYTHSTQTVQRENSGGERGKVVNINDCTMVTAINSENLVNRLFAFYCPSQSIKKIRTDLVFRAERCGKAYRFRNPFGEQDTAFLASAELTSSSFVRGACEFYAGYEPAGQAGLYQHCLILDKETFAEDGGVFTVPEEVFEAENPQIKVVMVGGGTGGFSGWPGANGQDAYTNTGVSDDADISGMWYGAEGGDGGQGGAGGAPGKVFSVVIENPAASYNYTIGDGGEGGEATGFIPDTVDELREALKNDEPNMDYSLTQLQQMVEQEQALTNWTGSPNAGTDGTASTFGTYTSDDPESYVPVAGIYNPIFGEFYALPGHAGIRGGKGGARRVGDSEVYTWVTDGEDVTGPDGTVYKGGKTGAPLTVVAGLAECQMTAYGGSGAGAAVGISSEDEAFSHINGGIDQTASWEVIENGV